MFFAQSGAIVEHKGAEPNRRNPIRPWFQASVDLGDHIGIRFGHVPPGAREPRWLYYSHADYDGIGGFAEILRDRGYDPGPLPTIPHESPRSWGPFLRSAPQFLAPRQRVAWKKNFGPPSIPRHDLPPEAVAWHVFDEQTTERITAASKEASCTVNSFLMSRLAEAVFPDVAEETKSMGWMVPVNLRGKVSRGRDSENHVSFVRIALERGDSPQKVHRKIYRELGRGEHWANWNAYIATRFLPLWAKRAMIRADRATSQFTIGVFSNLGRWSGDSRPDLKGDWLFAPPAIRFFRIAAGCVTWQGRLSLCIHLHPHISSDSADARSWMESWKAGIERELR